MAIYCLIMSKQYQTAVFTISPEQRARLNAERMRRTIERGEPVSLSELLREALDCRFPPTADTNPTKAA